MSLRARWRWCVGAGVLAFVASFLFGNIPGLMACGPSGGLGPILAFEFVRAPTDVATLFGLEPCRSTLVGAQRTGLLLDGLWFIPTYTAFLVLAALATSVRWRRWLVAALLIAAACDEIEGWVLAAILNALPGTTGQIGALGTVVHTKFALLALGTFGIGWALAPRPRNWRRLPGLLTAAAGLYALLELATGRHAAMMHGFTIGWVTLLALAAYRAVARDTSDRAR